MSCKEEKAYDSLLSLFLEMMLECRAFAKLKMNYCIYIFN